jgi:hypothetical protein
MEVAQEQLATAADAFAATAALSFQQADGSDTPNVKRLTKQRNSTYVRTYSCICHDGRLNNIQAKMKPFARDRVINR